MTNRTGLGALLALAALTPLPLSGQTLSQVCAEVGKLDSGSYVTYEIEGGRAAGQEIQQMRFALVGEGAGGSAGGYWYEFKAVAQEPIIVQMLVPAFPFDPADIKSMVLKAGNQPAMRIPSEMLAFVRSQMNQNALADFGKKCAESELLATESVSVPAGSFRALHIRTQEGTGEAWISSEIPFGMVKAITETGEAMVLTGFGFDAVSSITETPIEMPLPGLSGPGSSAD